MTHMYGNAARNDLWNKFSEVRFQSFPSTFAVMPPGAISSGHKLIRKIGLEASNRERERKRVRKER